MPKGTPPNSDTALKPSQFMTDEFRDGFATSKQVIKSTDGTDPRTADDKGRLDAHH
jgi:hypothetical protein